MISEKVQNLFDFIDFLHSSKDYFLSKKEVANRIKLLKDDLAKLDLKNSPEDILKSRDLNNQINNISDPEFSEVKELIESNVSRFNVSDDFDVKKGININAQSDLVILKDTFEADDIEVIKSAMKKYDDFKTSSFEPISNFFDLASKIFFDHLDTVLDDTLTMFGKKAKKDSIKFIIENSKSESVPLPQQIKPKIEIVPDTMESFFNIMKVFFNSECQNEFYTLLKTFENREIKLTFKSNANRLADAFKTLIKNDLITGIRQDELIKWLANNFNYVHNGVIKPLKEKTLEQTISSNINPCKNPIIEIKNGEIQKIIY